MNLECDKARENLIIDVHITPITFFYDIYRTIRCNIIVKCHSDDYV